MKIRLFVALLGALPPAVPCAAELLVAPTRVNLSATSRSAELVLVNKGVEAAAFRIAIENRRMRPDGSLEAATNPQPDEKFADDKLRFSPRQLTLEPGARQVVRVMADIAPDLAPGEYRSHLRLMSAPVSAARSLPTAAQAGDNSLSIELIAIRSLTVPIILRVGKLDAAVNLDAAALNGPASSQLVLKLARTGSRSTYGDISLTIDGEKAPAWVVRRGHLHAQRRPRCHPAAAARSEGQGRRQARAHRLCLHRRRRADAGRHHACKPHGHPVTRGQSSPAIRPVLAGHTLAPVARRVAAGHGASRRSTARS